MDVLEETIKKAHFEENKTNYSELFPQDEEALCVLQKRRNDIAKIPVMSLDAAVYGKDQYIVFHLNNHTYCVYSLFVKELINVKNYPVTKIPYTPVYINGIINHKGNFYTVMDLKQFIGLEDKNSEIHHDDLSDKKIIVLESSELKLALLVDDIVNIINIAKESMEVKNDMALDNMFIHAEAFIDNQVYNILNVDKLINDKRLYVDNSN